MSDGPVFQSEPGWGGKLQNWLGANFSRFILPLAAIIVVVLIIASISDNNRADDLSVDNPNLNATVTPLNSTPTSGVVQVDVLPGDSYTIIARRAISVYVDRTGFEATSGQRLYAETILQGELHNHQLEAGNTISIDVNSIQSILLTFNSLTDGQRRAWENNARRVQF